MDYYKYIKSNCKIKLKELNHTEAYINRLDWELDAIKKGETAFSFYNAQKLLRKLGLESCEVECKNVLHSSLVAYLLGISCIDPIKAKLHPEFVFGLDEKKETDIYINIPNEKIKEMLEFFGDIKTEDSVYQVFPNVNISYDVSTSIIYDMVNKTGVDVNSITNFTFDECTAMIPHIDCQKGKEVIKLLSPKNFDDLVKIIGLIHGANIWADNTKEFVESGICTINNIITTREDVYDMLLANDVPKPEAYRIAEKVRKGMGLTPEDEAILYLHNLPGWFIFVCKKTRYLYSRACAYRNALNTWWCMWLRKNYPLEYTVTYKNNVFK